MSRENNQNSERKHSTDVAEKHPAVTMRGLGKGSSGIALAESIIAIAIISTAVVGLLSLLATSLRQAEISRSQFIASHLALEGLEVVRAIRDANWIRRPPNPWNHGLAPRSDYQVQFNSTALTTFTGNEPPQLTLDQDGHYRQDGTGSPTGFRRHIIISDISTNTIRVRSTVSWAVRGVPFTLNAETRLYNWLRSP